jgi:hypothetical protein
MTSMVASVAGATHSLPMNSRSRVSIEHSDRVEV